MRIFIFFIVLLFGCSTGSTLGKKNTKGVNSTTSDGRVIKFVFFNFYEKNIVLTINGVVVLDDVLRVKDDTTGLSLVNKYKLKQDNVLLLNINGVQHEKKLIIKPETKLIYVNPNVEPLVVSSESDVVLLE